MLTARIRVFFCKKNYVFVKGITGSAAYWMAASVSLQTKYAAGAQHYEVHSTEPEYLEIKSDLESAGLVLKRLVKLTHTILEEKFQTEADYLVKVKPPGEQVFSVSFCYIVM